MVILSSKLFVFVGAVACLALVALATEDICIELTVRFATLAPDGVPKEVITINDQFPGPTIRAQLGDRLTVRFHNRLITANGTRYPTSVHFHGIEMKMTPWMDGPEQVTQCPIPYNGHMDYTFTLHQAGTYWYHSHHSWQYIDGFWGFLIVDNNRTDVSLRERNEVYADDGELLITLTDWHWRSGEELSRIFHLPSTSSVYEASQTPLPDSALINGYGNANCVNATSLPRDTYNITQCNDGVADQVTILNVIRGRTYRIRVLNPSARASFVFSIVGHQLNVIEMDGVDTVPIGPVDRVTIWPAQRYSFLVTMNMPKRFGSFARIAAHMEIEGPAEMQVRINRRLSRIQPLAFIHYLGEETEIPHDCPDMSLAGGPVGASGNPGFVEHDRALLAFLTENTVPAMGTGGQKQGRPSDRTVPWNDTIVSWAASTHNIDVTPVCRLNSITQNRELAETRRDVKCLFVNHIPSPMNPVIFNQDWAKPIKNTVSEHDLPPELEPDSPTITLNITLNPDFTRNGHRFPRWTINDQSYSTERSHMPAFFKVMERLPVPAQFLPQYTRLGKVVQVVINNRAGAHPYHMHGHTFWVMGTGQPNDGDFDPRRHRLDEQNAIRRDTTHAFNNSWTVVRFCTNNPGVWIMHCHIHWHFDHGLAMVFVEGQRELPRFYDVPAEPIRVCQENNVLVRVSK